MLRASKEAFAMTIEIGARLPEATLRESVEFGDVCPVSPETVSVTEATKGKKIVIFGVPGAFTSTCSERHLPGYIQSVDALRARGIDEVWCVSVNDGFVMAAWGKSQDAIGKIRFLGDGSAEFAQKLGLERDLTASGMGLRMKRFSMFVDDGIVKTLNVEAPGKLEVSDAATMLRQVS
jgi:peroxiredoxin